jgi:D-sedoheptulose 7-phosphate isomerase
LLISAFGGSAMHGNEARGLIYTLLLLFIFESPGHGYELIDRLACVGVTGIEPGRVYRVLRSLERDRLVSSGWVTSGTGPARRRYEVTSKGCSELRSWMTELAELDEVLGASLTRWAKASGQWNARPLLLSRNHAWSYEGGAAMSQPPVPPAVGEAFGRRENPGKALAADAEQVARACRDMALRFHRAGKLIVFGNGGAAADAQHVAVEFVHPVIVGKRALPAISLANDAATLTGIARAKGFEATFAAQLKLLASADDIAMGISPDGRCVNVLRGLETAHDLGLLTIALVGGAGGLLADNKALDHLLIAHSDDPCVVKEVHVTIYHILWELVHVFFEQAGLLGPEVIR